MNSALRGPHIAISYILPADKAKPKHRVTMPDSILSILSNINYSTTWVPDQELMYKVFSSIAHSSLSSPERPYREEEGSTFPLLMNNDVLLWFWDSFPAERERYLSRLIYLYTYTKYSWKSNSHQTIVGQSQRELIARICTDSFDALPGDSDNLEIQTLRVSLCSLPINRSIDYAARLMEANLSANSSMAEFWRREGMERSKDPAFYSMAWSKIERSVGYTDRRSSVIDSASKCPDFPESIINDLINSGHHKNRSCLIGVFTSRINNQNDLINTYKYQHDEDLKKTALEEIRYCQSVLARFAGCEDVYIQQKIIPYLRREDLIFAAPTASKLGLQKLLDRYMNGEEVKTSYRY